MLSGRNVLCVMDSIIAVSSLELNGNWPVIERTRLLAKTMCHASLASNGFWIWSTAFSRWRNTGLGEVISTRMTIEPRRIHPQDDARGRALLIIAADLPVFSAGIESVIVELALSGARQRCAGPRGWPPGCGAM